jgi:hypothetical protein
MNKALLSLAAVSSLLAASLTFANAPANAATNSSYYSTLKPLPKASMQANAAMRATDIMVVNASSDWISAQVPFTSINDALSPGATDHIYNDYLYGNTQLVIQNSQYFTILNDYVCNHAVVTIANGRTFGSYSVTIYNGYCS